MIREQERIAIAIRCSLTEGELAEPAVSSKDVRELRERLEQEYDNLGAYVEAIVTFEKQRGLS